MILAAAVAIVLVPVLVTASMLRARRPPLRTRQEERQEEQLMEAHDGHVDAMLWRRSSSPIDRSRPIDDLKPIEGRESRNADRTRELPWQVIDAQRDEPRSGGETPRR